MKKIDLSQLKSKANLSKFLTPILIATIAISLLFCLKTLVGLFKSDAIFFSDIVTLLAQAVYVAATILAFMRNPMVKKILLYAPALSILLVVSSGSAFIVTLVWTILTSALLYLIYQIKREETPYWELITGEKSEDVDVKDRVQDYLNKPIEEGAISKSVKFIVIGVIAAFVALLLFARAQVDFNIQWNMFGSWMFGLLYPIGLIMTFSTPIGDITPMQKGPDDDEWKPNNDITEVLFASFFLPFMLRFAVFPAVGAALIYYPLMCVFALVEFIIPFLFVVLIAGFIPLYLFIDSYLKDKKSTNAARVAPIATVVCAALLSLVWLQNTENKMDVVFSRMQLTSPKTEQVVEPTESATPETSATKADVEVPDAEVKEEEPKVE